MPTQKPRTMITFNDEELYKAVDEYRFEHRFRSQNEALMALINKGIEVLTGETRTDIEPAVKLSAEDQRVLSAYHAADASARHYALQLLENNPSAKQGKSLA